jgi:hypothetical protein
LTARTADVLFGVFTHERAYLIGIYAHPNHTNWAAKKIFAVMIRNWPNDGLAVELRGLGLSQKFSDEDRLQLRSAGVANLMEVDGKVYVPGRLGITTAGTPTEATRSANEVMWALQSWREGDPYERLREADDVPDSAYWLPSVQVNRPGFEEYCGFAARGAFYPVARII